jgi:hypothetical protein
LAVTLACRRWVSIVLGCRKVASTTAVRVLWTH